MLAEKEEALLAMPQCQSSLPVFLIRDSNARDSNMLIWNCTFHNSLQRQVSNNKNDASTNRGMNFPEKLSSWEGYPSAVISASFLLCSMWI